MKIGLLISGRLGLTLLNYIIDKYIIDFVMTDNKSDDIINKCKTEKIDIFIGNPRNGKCSSFISKREIDILASINYLFLIERELIELPKVLAFNIHGSLLPKYRGRTPHVWAIINNEIETGITAHIINKECDKGEIIEQIKIDIDGNDTGADILNRFESLYIPLFDSVIKNICNNTLKIKTQNENNATYFGKRTPEDGLINWSWQKERIRNWVRAQANPYPGAFTFYNNQKVVIDKIVFSDKGFSDNMPNGLIIDINQNIYVKTPNGVVELVDVRTKNINIEIGNVFKNE